MRSGAINIAVAFATANVRQSDKHGKKYVKHHIDGEKNKNMGERKGKDVIEQVRRRKWTWAVRM